MKQKKIDTLFLDIGGVLLTNGWDRGARAAAVKQFKLDMEDLEERHHLSFDTYESGKLSLDIYLDRIVFFKKRSFTKETFRDFMFSQSQALRGSLSFFKDLKKRNGLRVLAVSNEGRELNAYRTEKFRLNELFNGYISSSYVHLRKPDTDIYRMALDVSQSHPSRVLYIDDRLMFVQVARSLGMTGYHFTGVAEAKQHLRELGLKVKK